MKPYWLTRHLRVCALLTIVAVLVVQFGGMLRITRCHCYPLSQNVGVNRRLGVWVRNDDGWWTVSCAVWWGECRCVLPLLRPVREWLPVQWIRAALAAGEVEG